MKLTLDAFAKLSTPADVIIHSLEQALYQVTVEIDGQIHLLVDKKGKPVRHHNLQGIREMLHSLPVASTRLRHESAYDEMIGQPEKKHSNALEVELAPLDYPAPTVQ